MSRKIRHSKEWPGLNEDEIHQIRQAFDLFDTQSNGRIDPRDLKEAMESIGLNKKNQTIFGVIADVEKDGRDLDFQRFMDGITFRLGDKDTREGINKIFDLYDDDLSGTINIKNMRRVAMQLCETTSSEDLQKVLQRASSNGKEITREDFYEIMTKRMF